MSPRTEQQFLALREKSRDKIIEAATALFARQGYHGTSISSIAKTAEVSKGLMYNYFESKEQLLDAILIKGFEEFDNPMAQMNDVKDPYDKLSLLIEATFASVTSKKDRLRWQFLISIMTQPEVMKRIKGKFEEYMSGYLILFENLFNEMNVPNPKIEAYRLAAMLDGVMMHYLSLFGKTYPLEDMKNEILKQYEKYRLV